MLALLLGLLLGVAEAAATVEVAQIARAGGRDQVMVTIAETSASSASEVTISGLPRCGVIVSYRATLSAGTGTTIHPVVGLAAGFATSTQDHLATATTTAAFVNEQGATAFCSADGKLYVRSTPNNAAADHTITTQIVIVEGAL